MHIRLASLFADPFTQSPLVFEAFEQTGDEVINGAFMSEAKNLYPVINQVPVFLKNHIPAGFAIQFKTQLAALANGENEVARQILNSTQRFSFSMEWDEAYTDKVDKVWGQTREFRLQEHLVDTQTKPEDYPGLKVLDVGCGNGILCKSLADLGATMFGIDYSDSVWNAQRGQHHPNACFVKADLHHLPFADGFFDLVYSNGVIHHTANTENAFRQVLAKVRVGGKFYVWLYKRGESIGFNTYLRVTDAMRYIVNKLPQPVQKRIINALVAAKVQYNRLRRRKLPDVATAKLELYDTLTPQYKYYHTPVEVYDWHKRYGLTQSALTHINPYGFGVLGVKGNG